MADHSSDSIFARISEITANGPTDDQIQHASEVAQEHHRVTTIAAATAAMAAMSISDSGAAASSSATSSSVASTSPSFLTDDEIARYERDITEVCITSPLFANMLPTTFGLDGMLTGVCFNESTLIPIVSEHLTFPCIRAVCNFGDVKTADFDRLVAEHKIDLSTTIKSARARSKKQQRAGTKKRKTQGNGTSFNSSILFWIYSNERQTVYKIRLFRTGKFGLPGTKPEMIRDILHIMCDSFIPMLDRMLRARDTAAASAATTATAPITIKYLVSIMKNYKWRRMIDPGCILDLHAISERIHGDSAVRGRIPYAVNYAYYGYSDSKLSVKFHTPSRSRADKTVRINIFLSGKINILGAYDSVVTKNICQYIVDLLSDPHFIIRPSSDIAAGELDYSDDDLSDDADENGDT